MLEAAGPALSILLRYVGLHFDFISAHHRYASLYQQLMMAGGRPLEHLVRKYPLPRSRAFGQLLKRGMGTGEFRRASIPDTAISIVGFAREKLTHAGPA